MKIEKLTVTLNLEIEEGAEIPRSVTSLLEASIEGAVQATLPAILGVCAIVRREGEA